MQPVAASHCGLDGDGRPRVEGKFLFLDAEKFFVRGVTYGAFPPDRHGHQFPESSDVAKDFVLMRQAGINTVLTYTVPPLSVLDQARDHGLRVIVTVPWMEYVCFLDRSATRREIRRQVRAAIASCRNRRMNCSLAKAAAKIILTATRRSKLSCRAQ